MIKSDALKVVVCLFVQYYNVLNTTALVCILKSIYGLIIDFKHIVTITAIAYYIQFSGVNGNVITVVGNHSSSTTTAAVLAVVQNRCRCDNMSQQHGNKISPTK